MEKFYFEEPSLKRKEDAMDYINEHVKYNSNINGSGSLEDYVLNEDKTYEQWLEKINNYKSNLITDPRVPSKTYFLVREPDEKILGMINIRLLLNDYLKEGAGHIGYGIRPSERRKGYNKINLYLGLLELQKHGVKEALLGCYKENIGSSKTMKSLGAKLLREQKEDDKIIEMYNIDVDKSVDEYKDIYEPMVIKKVKRPEGLRLSKMNYADAKEEYEALIDIPEENGFENPFKDISYEEFYNNAIESAIKESRGIGLKEEYVPQTIYFLWDNDEIVGMFKLRHYLNESLKDGAGHIGYGIRKSKQGKGYATIGLKLLIELAKKIIPENEIYLSVHKDNLASLKVQQKNGAYIDHEDEEEYYTRIKI